MAIQFRCRCGTPVTESGKCPGCGAVINIPKRACAAAASEADAAARAAAQPVVKRARYLAANPAAAVKPDASQKRPLGSAQRPCPRCGGPADFKIQTQVNSTGAAIGGALFGILGATLGAAASSKQVRCWLCSACGYRWQSNLPLV